MADYKQAGVDLDVHAGLIGHIRALAATTSRPGVIGGVGLFAGIFALGDGPGAPVLVASTDSVGTKVLLAAECGCHEAVGRDVVVHSANDVCTSGAAPLFFLDYLAVHSLESVAVLEIVGGVAAACREVGCALIGGETAQMPDLYRAGTYDLAGTMVGTVPRDRLVQPSPRPGDVVVGVPSTGLHTNGFSLVRRILTETGTDPREHADDLLRPSRLYSGDVARLLAEGATIRGMAHITGGGLPGNLDRALGANCDAVLESGSWARPPVFDWLRDLGGISEGEMRRVFNLGVGFCVIVPAAEADAVCTLVPGARRIGAVVSGAGQVWFS